MTLKLPLVIAFPRPYCRFLLSLGCAVFFGWLFVQTMLLNAKPLEGIEGEFIEILLLLLLLLLLLVLFAYACYLNYRYAKFILQREFIRLEAKGLTIWHRALGHLEPLFIPWSAMLDVWVDEVYKYKYDCFLVLVWREEGDFSYMDRAASVMLLMNSVIFHDADGNEIGGKALAQLLSSQIVAEIKPARPILTLDAAQLPDDFQEKWYFGTSGVVMDCLIFLIFGGILAAMVIALFLSLFLATFNEPGDMHAVIIMMFFMMLLFAIMLRVSMDSIRNWISDIKLRSYIRFDQQGLHYWYYGMKPGGEETILWESINYAGKVCKPNRRGGYDCFLYFLWVPRPDTSCFRKTIFNTSKPFFGSDSNREVTKRLLATIRKYSPNMGKYDFLLELSMNVFESRDRDFCE